MERLSENLVIDFLVQTTIIANVFALLVGLLMLLAPGWAAALSRIGNRWFSSRRLTKPLDIMRKLDDVPLRIPDYFGVVVLIASGYILIQGVRMFNGTSAVEGGRALAALFSAGAIPPPVWESLWLTLVFLLMLGSLLGILVGVLALVSVTRLWALSNATNRWISMRRGLKVVDMPYYGLDTLILKNPRAWGGVITLLALYALIALLRSPRLG